MRAHLSTAAPNAARPCCLNAAGELYYHSSAAIPGEVRDLRPRCLHDAREAACAEPKCCPGSWPDRVLSMQHATTPALQPTRAYERLPANRLSTPASCHTTPRHELHTSHARSAVPGPMHRHAFSMPSSHARYRGGGSCATTCGTLASSSCFTHVVRRAPMAKLPSAKPKPSGSGARSGDCTEVRLTSAHHALPSGPRIGSGCSAYMTLDSTYLRARLARVIKEHLRLHKRSFNIDVVVQHELARECGSKTAATVSLPFALARAS